MKIDFENQILALFDGYFGPFNTSHEKIKSIFVISAIIASIWNVFIKFRWHDEKLTLDHYLLLSDKCWTVLAGLEGIFFNIVCMCSRNNFNLNWISTRSWKYVFLKIDREKKASLVFLNKVEIKTKKHLVQDRKLMVFTRWL